MHTKTKSEIKIDLEPFHDRLWGVVDKSFKEARHVNKLRTEHEYPPYLYSRTFANNVFDALARNAIHEFAFEDKIQVRTEAQTVKFLFPGGVLLRFKKGNEAFLGQNQPTLAVQNFTCSDGLFKDLPADTSKIEIIWQANDLNTKLENVFVVARDADNLLWKYEIDPITIADVVNIADSTQQQGQSSATKSIVTPKSARRSASQTDNKK